MAHTVVLGAQWGDEGKGKIVDALASEQRFRAVVRYQGGDNAGHTVVVGEERHAFHLLPSGILHPQMTCVIGNGVVVNPHVLAEELELLSSRLGTERARLLISDKAHLVMPWHVVRDRIAGGVIGTTGRGIGPTYADCVDRRGIRWADAVSRERFAQRVQEELGWNQVLIQALLDHGQVPVNQRAQLGLEESLDAQRVVDGGWKAITRILEHPRVEVCSVGAYLNGLASDGLQILFEGAQATLLDVAHGTYPFVTSSHPTVGGVYVGSGFRPRELTVLGVAKAYTTRVGAGPFPTELTDPTGALLRERGHEFGTTTGRPRRCGWLDLTVLRYSKVVNGLDLLAVTKLDVLSGLESLKVAVAYDIAGVRRDTFTVHLADLERADVVFEELPGWEHDISAARRFEQLLPAAQAYVQLIEDSVGVSVQYVGVGPEREQLISRS